MTLVSTYLISVVVVWLSELLVELLALEVALVVALTSAVARFKIYESMFSILDRYYVIIGSIRLS